MSSIPIIFEKLGVDFVRKSLPILKKNHDLLVESLKIIPGLKPVPAQGTFYLAVLLDLDILNFNDDVEFIKKTLEEENL